MNLRYLVGGMAGALAICFVVVGGLRAGSHVHVKDMATPPAAIVKGLVKFQGTVPKPARIDMSADPKCAQSHSSGPTTEDIVADGKGGLANVFVFVSKGLGDARFEPPQEEAILEQKGCMYRPQVLAMQANQRLRIINADATIHNIHPAPNNNREWNQTQPPGVSVVETFTQEEVAIPVKCNIHPWMRTYVAVFNHPFFAVTSKDGAFAIGNLPPGTYTITAWHKKLGTTTQKVTIGSSETKTMEFVFKGPPGA
jgi:plastocyanin